MVHSLNFFSRIRAHTPHIGSRSYSSIWGQAREPSELGAGFAENYPSIAKREELMAESGEIIFSIEMGIFPSDGVLRRLAESEAGNGALEPDQEEGFAQPNVLG